MRLDSSQRAQGKENFEAVAAAFVVSVLLVVLPVSAQEAPGYSGVSSGTGEVGDPTTVNTEEAIPIGPFIFSPALQLSWQDRDNIFFTPDDEVGDQVLLAKARLLFEVPVYESYIRFSYAPHYRDYKEYQLEENWQHFFDAAAAFEFSSGLTLDLGYSYILGNLDVREVDPGGELFWGDRPFTKQRARVGSDYWITARDGITADLSWEDVEYDDPDLFYDYTRTRIGIGWLHQLSPILVMDLRYSLMNFDAQDNEFENNAYRDSTTNSLTLGLRGQLGPVVATGLRVGYAFMAFDPQPDEPQIEDYRGAVASGYISWEMAHGSILRLDLLHMPYPSAYGDNAYYIASGASLAYKLDRGSLFGQIRGRYQSNDYDRPDWITGEIRSDDIYTFGLGLGYRFTHYLSLWGSYLYEDRESLYRYSYTTNIFTLGLVFGW